MSNKERALSLVEQMIERSQKEDQAAYIAAIRAHKAVAKGDSWMTFHLKSLKTLIELINDSSH